VCQEAVGLHPFIQFIYGDAVAFGGVGVLQQFHQNCFDELLPLQHYLMLVYAVVFEGAHEFLRGFNDDWDLGFEALGWFVLPVELDNIIWL